jgi:hypothetical protein
VRRRYLLLVLILLLLAAGGVLSERILFPEAPKMLQVLSVRGEVTVEGVGRPATVLAAGARIVPGDSLRTGPQGEAVLQGRGNSTVSVDEHTVVRLEGVASDGLSRIAIQEGRIRAVVPDGSGGVEVHGGSEGASVVTRGGDIAVGVDGRGDLSVADFRGTANLTAGSATQALKAGDQATVSHGKIRFGSIPTAVRVKVAWPDAGPTREALQKVEITAPPGVMVRLDDRPVALDSSGRAVETVELKEGENRLRLQAKDVAGNKPKEEDSGLMVLDTRPPEIRGGKPRWK